MRACARARLDLIGQLGGVDFFLKFSSDLQSAVQNTKISMHGKVA